PADADAETRRQQIRRSMAEFFKRATPITGAAPSYAPSFTPRRAHPGISGVPETPAEPTRPGPVDAPPQPELRTTDTADAPPGSPGPVIQIHRCYLVAETPDGLLIIDQHALHERILFEQLSQQFTRGPLESQRLLLPEIIDVSPDQVAVIESHDDTLHRIGLELSAYGPGSIAVHAAPSLLRPERTREFVRDLIDRLTDRQAPASTELLVNDLLAMMACKAAVKAGDSLTPDEIAALMSQRPRVDRSTNCPHGRPTSLRLTIADLERQFKRTGF
ncbi:MAG: hypothetical protein HY718_19465, partial [Planctomycetes bacterium]|nr:hypothetical protein [Planctomycetota bacterium]